MARDKSRTTRLIEAGATVDTTRKRKRKKTGDAEPVKEAEAPVEVNEPPPVEVEEVEEMDDDDDSSEISEGELAEAMDQDDVGPVTKSGDKRFKVPTHDEMDQFKTAETMFKNSLFSMQVAELLEEVSVPYTKLKPLEELLHVLKTTIEAIEESTVTTALSSMTLVGRVQPELQFRPPTRVDLVGSYLARTLAKPALSVDLAVQMPSECFHPKDFLNYRYADKRALYLSHLAEVLSGMPQLESVQVEGFCKDALKPVLVLTPAKFGKGGKLASKFLIRIFPTVDQAVFPEAKLLPTRNNVRAPNEGESAADTPLHNNSVVEDMMLVPHVQLTHSVLGSATSLQECVILLKVWLKQHQLLDTVDGITGFTASMMLTHLIQQRAASPRMSSYQLFKIVLEFVVTSDFTGAGVAMDPEGAVENLPKFASRFNAVFLDSSNRLNLLARAGASAMTALKEEAKITLDVLRVSGSHCFDAVFVRAAAQFLQFDEVITLPDLPAQQQDLAECIPELTDTRAHSHKVEELLTQALGDRVMLVRSLSSKVPSRWDMNSEAPVQAVRYVGLVLVPDNAIRLVDKGPSSDQAEAARVFRAFWGDKAELRHFRDGTILESVVWEEAKGQELRIPEMISAHILHRHLQYPTSEMCFSGCALSPVLELPGAEGLVNVSVVQKCVDSFERVCTHIRGLKDLPLEVTTIQPICEVLRRTAVFGPFQSPLAGGTRKQLDTNNSRCVESLQAVISLEASGKWPDDLQAIAHLKAAFYLHLAKGLRKEHDIECKVSMDWLRVLCDGHVFELCISHPREIELLRADAKLHSAPAMNTLAPVSYTHLTLPTKRIV
eukprot:TRINITY_DN33114_c0_g1_i4.p1 TRINITY_DN33114_c0_g1~~TRINITY_DN33114_c0_g1_i4.p1  ORF type:complete len:834 (-),score=273.64 TRINITY_DN33114_c0_g1_i4:121-2622(-)